MRASRPRRAASGNVRLSERISAPSLAAKAAVDRVEALSVDRHAGQHDADDARIGQVEDDIAEAGDLQAFERQLDDLEVGAESLVPVDFGTELKRLARRAAAGRPRVQHGPAIAQAHDAVAVEHVGVDACRLRGAVGAQAEGAAAQLIDKLEGLQVERVSGARQQRLDVLEHRRNHQLEAETGGGVEQSASQRLDLSGPRRKDIGDVLRQEPGRGHGKTLLVKNEIVGGEPSRDADSEPEGGQASPDPRGH